MSNAKKQRKTIGLERLEISSRKLETPREHFMQRWAQLKNRNSKDLTEADKIKKRWQEYREELYKNVLMTQITTMVWSFTYSQTPWLVKSRGP